MTTLKSGVATRPFDAANYIDTLEDAVTYLNIVFEDGDPEEVADAIGVVARGLGKSNDGNLKTLAEEIGLSRSALYQSLSANGNPSLKTMLALLNHFGLKMQVAPQTVANDHKGDGKAIA
jgi:probable addiction module antidote protein